MRTIVSRAKKITAAAIFALAMLSALAGARPALAGIAGGETAFNKGDFTTATREFQGPAYRGDALAQYYLGVIHGDGLGVSQSHEEGLAWLMCVQKGVGLSRTLRQDARQKRTHILSRISPYDLKQAKMRATTICGITTTTETKYEPFAPKEYNPEDIRPERGFWGGIFFFPGDTMLTGAAVVLHELGLTLALGILFSIAGLFGDFLFLIVSLIGWFMASRVFLFFFSPILKMVLARDTLTGNSSVGPDPGQVRESERD